MVDAPCPCAGKPARSDLCGSRTGSMGTKGLPSLGLLNELDAQPRADVEMVTNTVQGLTCAISRMPPPMQQQIFTQVGLPNDDLLYSHLRRMNPTAKQQLIRETMAQNPPSKSEMVELLRHYDGSARRQIMTEVGCDLDKGDVIGFLQTMGSAEIKAILDNCNIKIKPTDDEIIEVMATYANDVIHRILKKINFFPDKEEIVKGLLHLSPDEQMQVMAQTNVRPPACEEAIMRDLHELRPDAIQRIFSAFGGTSISDEDIVNAMSPKTREQKEQIARQAGLDIISNTEVGITEAFCTLPVIKQKAALKMANCGTENWDHIVDAIKAMDPHKQVKMAFDAGIPYQPTESQLLGHIVSLPLATKKLIYKNMELKLSKQDLLDELRIVETYVMTDILHEVITGGAVVKFGDLVLLVKTLTQNEQQALLEVTEMKIVPTDQQVITALQLKPTPRAVFQMLRKTEIVPGKKDMLAMLLEYTETQPFVELARAMRRAGIETTNDEDISFHLSTRSVKQINAIMQNANQHFVHFSIGGIIEPFKNNLTPKKQRQWLVTLRGVIDGESMEDLLDSLARLDKTKASQFLAEARKRGLNVALDLTRQEIIGIIKGLDEMTRDDILREAGYIPSVKQMSEILNQMDEYERIKLIRSANIVLPPTLEEAVFVIGQYAPEEVSRAAFRAGVCLTNDNEIIHHLAQKPDCEKRRIAECANMLQFDYDDIINAIKKLDAAQQRSLLGEAGVGASAGSGCRPRPRIRLVR